MGRGRGRPRKHPIKQARTLWNKILPNMSPMGSPPRQHLGTPPHRPMSAPIEGIPYTETAPGVFTPQESHSWDASSAAKVLLRFRENVQKSLSKPTTPLVKSEQEATPVPQEVPYTAF